MSANRLERATADLAARRECGIAPYVTAGDGGLVRTLAVLHALERAGAACVELGIPFSDPIADGPILQAAASRSLQGGTTFDGILDLLRAYRDEGGALPVLAFTYANPLLRRGPGQAPRALAEAGFDGLLVPDLPLEEDALEAGELRAATLEEGLAPVFFVTPTTSDERARRADELSRGFVYVIGRTGITGRRTELDERVSAYLERVRGLCAKPLGVGFGIASAEQVAAVARRAELAIVGSALVQHVHEAARAASEEPDQVAAQAAFDYVSALRQGIPA